MGVVVQDARACRKGTAARIAQTVSPHSVAHALSVACPRACLALSEQIPVLGFQLPEPGVAEQAAYRAHMTRLPSS